MKKIESKPHYSNMLVKHIKKTGIAISAISKRSNIPAHLIRRKIKSHKWDEGDIIKLMNYFSK